MYLVYSKYIVYSIRENLNRKSCVRTDGLTGRVDWTKSGGKAS